MTNVSSLGERTAGVWSRRDALAVMTRGEVDAAVRSGRWQRPWPGVYADAGIELDAVQRAVAAVLASGGPARAVACGRTAARVWELPLIDDDDPATGAREHLLDEVAVRMHAARLRRRTPPRRVLVRRQLALGHGDVVRLGAGVAVTSVVRTVCDLAGRVSDEAVVCAIDDALRRDLLPRESLEDAVEGRAALRALLQVADDRAESPGETLARLLLRPRLPGLVPQVRVRDQAGRVVARCDLGDEALRLAVECDGRQGHAGELMVAKDRQRDAVTSRLGWTTERVTWFELRCRREATLARIVATAERVARIGGTA